MLNEGERERIRRAYYLHKKSIRRIAQEEGYSRDTVERAITDAPRSAYRLSRPRPAPRPGPYHTRIAALLEQSKHLPPKQRYTAHKIFEILQEEGYQGSEARVRQYLSERKQAIAAIAHMHVGENPRAPVLVAAGPLTPMLSISELSDVVRVS
jgi:transposase